MPRSPSNRLFCCRVLCLKFQACFLFPKHPPECINVFTQSMKSVQPRVQKTVWAANGGERNSSFWLPQATLCPLYPIKTSWLARRWLAHHACRRCSSSDTDRGGLFSLWQWWLHCSCTHWAFLLLSLMRKRARVLTTTQQHTKCSLSNFILWASNSNRPNPNTWRGTSAVHTERVLCLNVLEHMQTTFVKKQMTYRWSQKTLKLYSK